LFSNTFNVSSSFRVRDQVSNPYKTMEKIIFDLLGFYAFKLFYEYRISTFILVGM
jgi:hypothetical protein